MTAVMPWRAIVLIGPRAAGKTTLGQALAQRLGWGFADGDQRLEQRIGEPAGALLARAGEPAFRAVEEQVTLALLAEPSAEAPLVVALGGGAVLSARVRRRLASRALAVVLVIASPQELAGRIAKAPAARPPLTKLPLPEEVEAVLRARRPVYERLARVVVETTRAGVEECCAALLAGLAPNGR